MRLARIPRGPRPGFTLIELTVVGSIILVLAGLLLGAAQNARGLASDTKCLSNLRQISVALRLYMMNFDILPCDHPRADLARDLARFLGETEVLTCPMDRETPRRSYDPFYVSRRTDSSAQFVVGCPRHNGNRSAVNLMAESSVQYFDLASVKFTPGRRRERIRTRWRKTPTGAASGAKLVKPGDAVSAGTLSFEDGSTLSVSGNGKVVLLQSFRKSNGVLYTIVRIVAGTEAEVDVQVTPGSQFEVITPAAIAGVRGTRFTVQVAQQPTGISATTITVQEGVVWVTARPAAEQDFLTVDVPAGRQRQFVRRTRRLSER